MNQLVLIAAWIGAGGVIAGAAIASIITILSSWLQNKSEDSRLKITLHAQETREGKQLQFEVKKNSYVETLLLFAKHSDKHVAGIMELTPEEMDEINKVITVLPLFTGEGIFEKSKELMLLFADTPTPTSREDENKIIGELTQLMKNDLGI